MRTSVSINYFGQAMAVHGDYTAGLPATELNPAEPSEFEVEKAFLLIHLEGRPLEVDITEMLECLYTGPNGPLGALEYAGHLAADVIDQVGGV